MDQQHPEQIDGAVSAAPRSEWTRPEVDRLVAGGAEAAGDTSTDGIDTLS